MDAAGATGQVYEPDGMILGFISVINGPSLSVLWKERDALTGSGIHRVRFPQTERVNYIRVACVSTLVFVAARCKPLVPRPIRASGTGRGGGCFAAINPSRGRPYARIQFYNNEFLPESNFKRRASKTRFILFLVFIRIMKEAEQSIRGIVFFPPLLPSIT